MNKPLLTLTASAFLLATSMGLAQAQTSGDDDTMQQGEPGQGGQGTMGEGMMGGDRDDRKDGKDYRKRRDRHADMMRRHHGGGDYGMHGGMMGQGMMGHGRGHEAVMHIMFAIMDADGNGTLSLEEIRDIHSRIFAHVDADDDGQVTKDEIKEFFNGGKKRRGDRDRRGRSERSEGSDRSDNDDDDDDDDLNLSDDVDGDDDNGSAN